jgi:hypothetical protein
MKIDIEKINDLQSIFNYFLDGIKEAVLMGGDIRENCCDQIDDCRKKINEWNTLNIMPAEKEIVPDQKHIYLQRANEVYKKRDELEEENKRELFNNIHYTEKQLTHSEKTIIIQASIYAYIKRIMREKNNIPLTSDRSILNSYVDDIMFTPIIHQEYFKYYTTAMNHVLMDIVDEIIEDRNKVPQISLFNEQQTNLTEKKTKKNGHKKSI